MRISNTRRTPLRSRSPRSEHPHTVATAVGNAVIGEAVGNAVIGEAVGSAVIGEAVGNAVIGRPSATP
jgi:hypothetical protein